MASPWDSISYIYSGVNLGDWTIAIGDSELVMGRFKPTHFQKGTHVIIANPKTFCGAGGGG